MEPMALKVLQLTQLMIRFCPINQNHVPLRARELVQYVTGKSSPVTVIGDSFSVTNLRSKKA